MELILLALLFILIGGLMTGGSAMQATYAPKAGAVGCLLAFVVIFLAVMLLLGGIAGENGGLDIGPVRIQPTYAPGHGPRR